ncbi:yemanuclein [Drosophila willistoni]|nr:yemanuclein [Drosophila willistoni]
MSKTSSGSGEPKRVSLTTISQTETAAAAAAAFPSRFGGGDFLEPEVPSAKSSKTTNKSIRLKLELFETDSNKYPEFNYTKLLHVEKKRAKKLKGKTSGGPGSDPFGDNDDDVARIAKELEAKYGNAYVKGRGRSKKDDFCDIGMGYDESDSFIDNTEAYDEVIPEEVETIKGGFYINCGALEFKNLIKKSYTTRTDEIIKMPERSRKRIISSSSDSSSSSSSDGEDNDDDDEDDDDDEEDDDEEEEEDGSDSESLEDEDTGSVAAAKAKKKYKDKLEKRQKSSASNEKAKIAINPSIDKKKTVKKLDGTSSSSNSPRPSAKENSDTDERQAQALKKVVKTTTVKDMLKAKRDSFLKSQGGTSNKGTHNGELKCNSTDVESSSENGGTDSATEQGKNEKQPKGNNGVDNLRTGDTALPTSLDNETLSIIQSFKDAVRSRDMCGKKFFFDDKLTALLLKLYESLLCTDRNARNMVYAHLEYQLQLPKYFILRKAKAMISKEERNKSTNALDKLRKAITEIMPRAIANYEIELHQCSIQAAVDINSEHPPKMPRKKFQWNSELRQLLYDVYQARWTSYAVLGKRKDSLEEFINGYLKKKVVELWPKGWMHYDDLQREIDRYKNTSKKTKDKPKAKGLAAPISNAESLSSHASNYLKPIIEESRSRANSDTDSATSASSNSLKRKLKEPPSTKPNVKPPKVKKTAAAAAAKQTPQETQQPQHILPNPLETLLNMPSTSAQAAALAGVIDLASITKKTDHSIFNIMTASALAAASSVSGSKSIPVSPSVTATASLASTSANATTIKVGNQHSNMSVSTARPTPHIINLDDYRSPSDILQTSKQLVATNVSNTKPNNSITISPAQEARWESSGESDGVEFVGCYPATKPGVKNKVAHKTKVKPSSANGANLSVGSLGFKMDNMYVYNNNNNAKLGLPMSAAGVAAGALGQHAFDLTNPHIIKAMNDLKTLEKQMKCSPQFTTVVSPSSLKSAGAGTAATGAGTPSTPQ